MNEGLISLFIGTILGIALPLGLLIYWKRKTNVKFKPFIVGMMCFVIFANVLESFAHQYFLLGGSGISKLITSSPILYATYGCLAAGIFEETGRYVGFKYFLKESNDKNDAIAYGIGHGGIEVILVLVATYLIYQLALLGVNFGETTGQIAYVANSITVTNVILALIERVFAMIFHISLSMIVYIAIKKEGQFKYYPLAILLHALLDLPAMMFQLGILKSLVLVEIVIALITLIVFNYCKKVFIKEF